MRPLRQNIDGHDLVLMTVKRMDEAECSRIPEPCRPIVASCGEDGTMSLLIAEIRDEAGVSRYDVEGLLLSQVPHSDRVIATPRAHLPAVWGEVNREDLLVMPL